MSEIVTRECSIERVKGEVEFFRRAVRVTASTDAVDSYREIVEQDWILNDFVRNPIVLYQHRTSEPIGTAEDVVVENGALKATLVFAPAGVTAEADKAWSLIEAGIIKTVSVGFVPGDYRYEVRDGREVVVLSKNKLKEISVVSLPANPNALIEARVKSQERKRSRMDEELKALLEANGVKSISELNGRLKGLETAVAEASKHAQELVAMRAAESERRAVELVERAIVDGRLTPASRESMVAMAKKDHDFVEGLLAVLPVLVKQSPTQVAPRGDATISLTANEIRIAKSVGISPAQFAEEKRLRNATKEQV